MQIFVLVLTLLNALVPAVARVLAAINESQQGGIKSYDRLLQIAGDAVKQVAAQAATPSTMPGGEETKWDRNIRLYAQAIYLTIDAAERAGLAVKDHQVSQAVNDAYTAFKMAASRNSETETTNDA
jgi:hypothetical protein